jgi:hypothetical protein
MSAATHFPKPELGDALQEIQAHWTDTERSRRHRLAMLRQSRLLRMLGTQAGPEAYPCVCDTDASFESGSGPNDRLGEKRSRRYVVVGR